MRPRIASLLSVLLIATGGSVASAQIETFSPRRATPLTPTPAPNVAQPIATGWQDATRRTVRRDPEVRQAAATEPTTPAAAPLEPLKGGARRARVTNGDGKLPNNHGQVWREYDITPYTLRATTTNRPEQAIIDWILRETGYEAWHSDIVSLLHADHRTLTVYHTPEMQSLVTDIVDRFVNSEAETRAFSIRVVTVGSPNWRAKAHPMLRPVAAQTQGVQAWVLAKEDAALLMAELRKRIDFREHSSPELLVNNGQSTSVASIRPHTYTKDITVRAAGFPTYDPEMGHYDEGFVIELSPLLSLDGTTIDAVLKCNIDQLERLVPVVLEAPGIGGARQRVRVEVPQVSHCRLHERFRWPEHQVLLVDLGVVATPAPVEGLLQAINPFSNSPPRANLLVMIESKGSATAAAAPIGVTQQPSNFRARY